MRLLQLKVLVIQETKLDETFPEKAFMIPGYKNHVENIEIVMGEG